jgi:O-antigen ligase
MKRIQFSYKRQYAAVPNARPKDEVGGQSRWRLYSTGTMLAVVNLLLFYSRYGDDGMAVVGRPDRYVALAFVAAVILIRRRTLDLRQLWESPLLWLAMFSLSTLVGSRGSSEAVFRSMSYIVFLLFAVIYVEDAESHNALNIVLGPLVVTSIIASISSLAYMPTQPNARLIGALVSPRVGYSNPNSLGTLSACLVVIALNWLPRQRTLPWATLMPLGLLVVFLTGSRTAFVAMIVATVFSALANRTATRRLFFTIVGVGLVALLIPSLRGQFPYIETAASRVDPRVLLQIKLAEADPYRWRGIQNGITTFLEHPIFGGGINQLGILHAFGDPGENGYVSILADTGIVGFTFFSMWVAATCRALLVCYRAPECVAARSSIISATALMVLFLANIVFEAYFRAVGNIATASMILISAGIARLDSARITRQYNAKFAGKCCVDGHSAAPRSAGSLRRRRTTIRHAPPNLSQFSARPLCYPPSDPGVA